MRNLIFLSYGGRALTEVEKQNLEQAIATEEEKVGTLLANMLSILDGIEVDLKNTIRSFNDVDLEHYYIGDELK